MQGCFYAARRAQAEVSINIKLDVCICGAGRGALSVSWTKQTLVLQCSVLLRSLSMLHLEDHVGSPIRIFRNSCPNESQNKFYNKHDTHKRPTPFHQMVVFR